MSGCARVESIAGQAIALLGDGQRHQAHVRIGQPRKHLRLLAWRTQHLANRTDDAPLRGLPKQFQRIQPILRLQRIAHVRAAQGHAAHRPLRLARQHLVQVHGLVGAMEGADAQMHDANTSRRTVIGRTCHAGRQPVQRGLAQACNLLAHQRVTV